MLVPFGKRSAQAVKSAGRPVLQRLRAVPVELDRYRQAGPGPWAVFLPSGPPEGAALLRMYNIAAHLQSLGWRTLVMPWRLSLAHRVRLLRKTPPGVLIMQGARHALNRPGLYPDWPILYDLDDADFHLPHLEDPVRRAMGEVTAVLAGSRYIADWCRDAGATAHVVWTGTPVSSRAHTPHEARAPVIAWAQTRPMTYTREAEMVRDVITRIGQTHPGITLRLYDRQTGDDDGFAARFRAPGVSVEWVPTLSYRDYLRSFDDVSLGLAPLCPENPFSRGKSFGKLLGYLDASVPVIASDVGEHGQFFTPASGVVSNDLDQWVQAALDLLRHPERRTDMALAASLAFRQRLSLEAAAEEVEGVLRRYLPWSVLHSGSAIGFAR